MAVYVIFAREEHLDNKLCKILAERQSQGLLSIQRVVLSPYTMEMPAKPNKKPRQSPKPEDFVKAVKEVVNFAALKNGQEIETIDRGVVGSYVFWLDATKWCSTMDKLLTDHRNLIEDMLEKKQKATSVNILAPFIGALIDERVFQGSQKIRKVDLVDAFTRYYGKPQNSVKVKLSDTHNQSHEFHELVSETVKIAKEISKKACIIK